MELKHLPKNHHFPVAGMSAGSWTANDHQTSEQKADSQLKTVKNFTRNGCYIAFWAALVGMVLPLTTPAQTPEQVNRAISNGNSYLFSRQAPNGSWDELGTYPGGVTALATLALLSCDVPADNERIARALEYLRRLDDNDQPKDTYVVALMIMAFAEANPAGDIGIIKKYAKWLEDTQLPSGRWTYGRSPDRQLGQGDNSNTQFAILGLHAASQAGVDIPEAVWARCQRYWVGDQARVGSWGYVPGSASGSMTAAGVASLIIANREAVSVERGTFAGKPVRCDGARVDKNVEAGIGWLGRNFSVRLNPGGNNVWYFYYLYGLERAGRLSGRRFFGDHDWYRAGVRALTTQGAHGQRPDGSWHQGEQGAAAVFNTAFALLFLSKGRIPIVVNKLLHEPGEDWNNAPNDIHNLTQFLTKHWNVKLNWQIVDAKVASTADLLQAPVLHISGHDAPAFSPREKQILREFVSEGGLIMADANCSVAAFDAGFRALCKELFPEAGQELRSIEPEHGVWTSLFELKPDWPLFGIDVGCRTAVFYSPEDLSCQWEYAKEESSIAAMRMGANIVAYAAGPEELQDKLEERKIYKDVPEDQIRRGFLQIAKIRHNGDWNPAPMAIRNLMISMRELARVDVVAQERIIDLEDPNLLNYPLSYMHGRTKFQLTRPERESLARYLANGGVLFADACCGNEAFDQSFRELIKGMFPENPMVRIPSEHDLYTTRIGYDLSKAKLGPALENREGPPTLEGVEIEGRYVVIYSKLDLGCALQRQQSRDCKGYTHESAVQVATNIALYALKQ